MQIIVNGKTHTLRQSVTIQHLLDELQLTGRLAIEVNKAIIPRSQFSTHAIHPGDVVEIVRAIGGG